MFQFVLKLAADKSLPRGKTVTVDSTLLEAGAAMKSIVRRNTGEDCKTYLRGLAAEEASRIRRTKSCAASTKSAKARRSRTTTGNRGTTRKAPSPR
jgi:hypothetical protein